MGQKFAAFDAAGNITAFYDSIDSPPPGGLENISPLTDAQWQQAIGTTGCKIVNGSLVIPVPPSASVKLASQSRIWRDSLMSKCDWVVACHRDQLAANASMSLTDVQYQAWLAYRQALRDVPAQSGFPATITWPTAPSVPPLP